MNVEKIRLQLRITTVALGLSLLLAACDKQSTRNPNASRISRNPKSPTSPPLDSSQEQSQEMRIDEASRPRSSPAGTKISRPPSSLAINSAPTDERATTGSATPSPTPRYSSGCSTWEGGTIGVGFGGGPSCSYTAANSGGYLGQGQWRITIKRGENTIEIDSNRDPSCSQTGVIHPEDEVTAWVAMYSGYNSISVGEDAHC